MQPTPPGWYWDPGNRPGLFRWWDGHAWTEALSADRNAAPPIAPNLPSPGPDGRFSAGGLSVPALPEPWRPCPPYPAHLVEAAGQELVVGHTPRGPYVAAVFVGALAPAWSGPDLRAATQGLADAVLQTYYPHERPRGSFEPSAVEVDGRPAQRVVVPMDVDDVHLPFTAETALFVVVDVGDATPAVLFASLPEAEHVPSPDDVLAALRLAPR